MTMIFTIIMTEMTAKNIQAGQIPANPHMMLVTTVRHAVNMEKGRQSYRASSAKASASKEVIVKKYKRK